MHDQAQIAAEAGQCANEQGQFWPYHDKMFENQRGLGAANLKSWAAELGLDTAKFNECLDSGRTTADVKRDFEEGSRAGVTGTPAFFINGRFLNGAKSFADFKKIIDEELAR